MARLKERYKKEIAPQLIKKYGYKNIMEVPRRQQDRIEYGHG
jgi:large subunit ribosomal protein L5